MIAQRSHQGESSMSAADARVLWEKGTPETWELARSAYGRVLVHQGVEGLADLDRWYREELPGTLQGRTPPLLEPHELVQLTMWKMRRGEWRPRNLGLVQSNSAARVQEASKHAFALAEMPRRAVEELCTLDGVGAATASAALAACRPDLYPFLDDLVGAALSELGEPKFTVTYYLRYATALRERAADLGGSWTAQDVGLALWAASGGKAGR
jgi:hypothetical protein